MGGAPQGAPPISTYVYTHDGRGVAEGARSRAHRQPESEPSPPCRRFPSWVSGGLSATLSIAVEDDGVPPVTTVTALKCTWKRTAVTPTLVVTDVGVGVARTFDRVGDCAQSPATSRLIAA